MFTDESIKLINYYNKLNIKFEYDDCINIFHKNIYNKFSFIENMINKNKILNKLENGYLCNKKETNEQIANISKDNFENNYYISENIKNYIIMKKTYLYKYKIPYYTSFITLNFYLYSELTIQKKAYIKKLIKNIIFLIFFISHITNNLNNINKNNCSINGLNIHLFFTPFKRQINSNNKVFEKNNVNGGFCYGCNNKGDIIVYRKQDLLKVLIHELLHNFGYDKQITKLNTIHIQKLLNKFNLQKEKISGFNECLVELWAIIIHISFISYKKSNNIKKYVSIYNNLINYEIIHSIYQVNKILNLNKIDNFVEMIEKPHNYKEETHVFFYYIIKSFLLVDFDILICKNIVQNEYLIFDINNFDKLLLYIYEIISKKEVINLYNKINNYYKNTKNVFVLNNLRMSCIEIDWKI